GQERRQGGGRRAGRMGPCEGRSPPAFSSRGRRPEGDVREPHDGRVHLGTPGGVVRGLRRLGAVSLPRRRGRRAEAPVLPGPDHHPRQLQDPVAAEREVRLRRRQPYTSTTTRRSSSGMSTRRGTATRGPTISSGSGGVWRTAAMYFYSRRNLTPRCLARQVLACDLRATSFRRTWSSTNAIARTSFNSGSSSAASRNRTVRSRVSSGTSA